MSGCLASAARRLAAPVAALLIGYAPASAHAQAAPDWRLVWEDGFNSLDGTKWQRVNSTQPTNNSLHAYLPQQVTVENGSLVLTSTDEPYAGLPYRSGQVISRSEQRFGRWEVSAKLPTSRGMWPAIWLLPDVSRTNWPSGGEIDILENRGNEPFLTSSAFHYGTNPPYVHRFVYDEQQTSLDGEPVNYHEGFHTYAVDWTDRYLRFYVDGVHHYTVYDEDVGGFLSADTQPMQLVINNAIGGHFLPNPDESTVWPQRMEVDWVRVYEESGSSGVVEAQNLGFEADGGTLRNWSVFGDEPRGSVNVLAATEAVRSGDASLKLFGPFQPGRTFSGVSQGITVEGGQEVAFSLSALVRSEDRLAGANEVWARLEFYEEFGAKYRGQAFLSEETLLVADAQTPLDQWLTSSLSALAPQDSREARLSLLFEQPSTDAGAIHIDDIQFAATPIGDFNADGLVNAADYTVWRDSLGQTGPGLAADADRNQVVDHEDLAAWRDRYTANLPAAPAQAPEPAAAWLLCLAALAGLRAGRRQQA
ncbi:family 16 glycosylhydrolase [Botrimarina sp.]|uniref:family 16 glycosylhydrolase n=1 Tax=Botrimarina sp. TaxID=2795802 RepID=UPI0032EF1CAF